MVSVTGVVPVEKEKIMRRYQRPVQQPKSSYWSEPLTITRTRVFIVLGIIIIASIFKIVQENMELSEREAEIRSYNLDKDEEEEMLERARHLHLMKYGR